MSSVYEDFDVLSTGEMLAQVNNIRVNSLTCWMLANSLLKVSIEKKQKGKIRQYGTIVKQSLVMFHLCEMFLKSKDSHDMHKAIIELNGLDAQRLSLESSNEFEAAAKIRDQQKEIRDYLTKKQQHESESIG